MQALEPIRVQVCHGDALLEAGLRSVLRNDPALFVVDGHEPAGAQVIIADYERGLMAARQPPAAAQATPAPAKVLVFTARCSEADVRAALRAGVHGYLVQGCSPQDAIQAAHTVHRGARYFCPLASERMASSLAHTALTAREVEVLGLLSSGLSNKLIARQMNLTVATIKSHVGAVLSKLGAASRTEAVVVAGHRGLVQAHHAGLERV